MKRLPDLSAVSESEDEDEDESGAYFLRSSCRGHHHEHDHGNCHSHEHTGATAAVPGYTPPLTPPEEGIRLPHSVTPTQSRSSTTYAQHRSTSSSGSPRSRVFDGDAWRWSPRTGYTYAHSATYRYEWTPDREVPMPHMARWPLDYYSGRRRPTRLLFSESSRPYLTDTLHKLLSPLHRLYQLLVICVAAYFHCTYRLWLILSSGGGLWRGEKRPLLTTPPEGGAVEAPWHFSTGASGVAALWGGVARVLSCVTTWLPEVPMRRQRRYGTSKRKQLRPSTRYSLRLRGLQAPDHGQLPHWRRARHTRHSQEQDEEEEEESMVQGSVNNLLDSLGYFSESDIDEDDDDSEDAHSSPYFFVSKLSGVVLMPVALCWSALKSVQAAFSGFMIGAMNEREYAGQETRREPGILMVLFKKLSYLPALLASLLTFPLKAVIKFLLLFELPDSSFQMQQGGGHRGYGAISFLHRAYYSLLDRLGYFVHLRQPDADTQHDNSARPRSNGTHNVMMSSQQCQSWYSRGWKSVLDFSRTLFGGPSSHPDGQNDRLKMDELQGRQAREENVLPSTLDGHEDRRFAETQFLQHERTELPPSRLAALCQKIPCSLLPLLLLLTLVVCLMMTLWASSQPYIETGPSVPGWEDLTMHLQDGLVSMANALILSYRRALDLWSSAWTLLMALGAGSKALQSPDLILDMDPQLVAEKVLKHPTFISWFSQHSEDTPLPDDAALYQLNTNISGLEHSLEIQLDQLWQNALPLLEDQKSNGQLKQLVDLVSDQVRHLSDAWKQELGRFSAQVIIIQEQLSVLRVQVDHMKTQLGGLQLLVETRCCAPGLLHQVVLEKLQGWLSSLLTQQQLDLTLKESVSQIREQIGEAVETKILKLLAAHQDTLIQSALQRLVETKDSSLSRSDVKRLVQDALLMYAADKTGLFDFALETAGGSVVSTRCTESVAKFSLVTWWSANSPRTAIQPGVHPGDCWAFKGSIGHLVIQLSKPIKPTRFSIEHIPKLMSPDGRVDSAPRDFIVLGLQDEFDPEPVDLGRYTYDAHEGPPLQMFNVDRPVPEAVRLVELNILSNHGNLNYTCLYRFRVHGQANDII